MPEASSYVVEETTKKSIKTGKVVGGRRVVRKYSGSKSGGSYSIVSSQDLSQEESQSIATQQEQQKAKLVTPTITPTQINKEIAKQTFTQSLTAAETTGRAMKRGLDVFFPFSEQLTAEQRERFYTYDYDVKKIVPSSGAEEGEGTKNLRNFLLDSASTFTPSGYARKYKALKDSEDEIKRDREDAVKAEERASYQRSVSAGITEDYTSAGAKISYYDPLVSSGTFTGTDEQYTDYLKAIEEYNAIAPRVEKYNRDVDILNTDFRLISARMGSTASTAELSLGSDNKYHRALGRAGLIIEAGGEAFVIGQGLGLISQATGLATLASKIPATPAMKALLPLGLTTAYSFAPTMGEYKKYGADVAIIGTASRFAGIGGIQSTIMAYKGTTPYMSKEVTITQRWNPSITQQTTYFPKDSKIGFTQQSTSYSGVEMYTQKTPTQFWKGGAETYLWSQPISQTYISAGGVGKVSPRLANIELAKLSDAQLQDFSNYKGSGSYFISQQRQVGGLLSTSSSASNLMGYGKITKFGEGFSGVTTTTNQDTAFIVGKATKSVLPSGLPMTKTEGFIYTGQGQPGLYFGTTIGKPSPISSSSLTKMTFNPDSLLKIGYTPSDISSIYGSTTTTSTSQITLGLPIQTQPVSSVPTIPSIRPDLSTLGAFSLLSTDTKTKDKSLSRVDSRQWTGVLFPSSRGDFTLPFTSQSLNTMSGSALVTETSTPLIPVQTPVIITPPFVPGLPSFPKSPGFPGLPSTPFFDLGGFGKDINIPRISGRQPKGYTPSFAALVLGIEGSPSADISMAGLGLRPIPITTKKKKRRKK